MKAAIIVAVFVGLMGLCASIVLPQLWFPSLVVIAGAVVCSIIGLVQERR